MTKKKRSAFNHDRLFSLDSFFISISQLANNRKRGIVLMVCTRGKILMERFRLSAGDRETFFSIESAGRTIYTLPAHPLILFGVRLSLSHSLSFHDLFHDRRTGINRSLPIRNMEMKCRNFLGFGVNLGFKSTIVRRRICFWSVFHLDTCHSSALGLRIRRG